MRLILIIIQDMNKKLILDNLIAIMEKEIPELMAAARATYDAATNEESRPENEYDTRGLEASYLAGAQAKRVAELEKDIHDLKQLKIQNFTTQDPIRSTALIEVDHLGKTQWMFLLPRGGGRILELNHQKIQVITPTSPLGEALLGLKVGDVAIVEANLDTKEYEILSLI